MAKFIMLTWKIYNIVAYETSAIQNMHNSQTQSSN